MLPGVIGELFGVHSTTSSAADVKCASLNLDAGGLDDFRVGRNLPFYEVVKFGRGQDRWLNAKTREFIR
jgi:hypothetical protein